MATDDRQWHDGIATRPWKPSERRVVMRGFLGRLAIAVEPLLVAAFFVALPVGLFVRKLDTAIFLAPIFGLGAIAFMTYAVVLIAPSARAVIETFGHIYVVDGYIRYRKHKEADEPAAYFVAVLGPDHRPLREWPLTARPSALDQADLWPALVEFSRDGIHSIDGRETGILPEAMPPLGVGTSRKIR